MMRPRMMSALAVLGAAGAIGGATIAHAASTLDQHDHHPGGEHDGEQQFAPDERQHRFDRLRRVRAAGRGGREALSEHVRLELVQHGPAEHDGQLDTRRGPRPSAGDHARGDGRSARLAASPALARPRWRPDYPAANGSRDAPAARRHRPATLARSRWPIYTGRPADVAQLARASACHAEGRGFESLHPLSKAP